MTRKTSPGLGAELAWTHASADIPQAGLAAEREASADELAGVAHALELVACTRLTAAYTIVPTIAGRHQLTGKLRAEISGGVLPGPQALDARIEVAKGDRLFFSADITSAETGDKNAPSPAEVVLISSPSVVYESSQPVVVQPDVDVHVGLAPSDAFGGGFRGWWFGQYNGRDGAFQALVALAAQARQTNRIVNLREEADGMIYEIYLW